ncbi:MAG: hypothetical protein WCK33_12155 [Phycisphaerae bacterium]
MKSCVKACGVLAAVLMAASGSASAQVIISEVVSGSMLSANPKFVELTNVSATRTITLGANDALRLYSNTATTSTLVYDFGANAGANNVTLLPGQSWTIALSGTTAGTSWNLAYGVANQPSLFQANTPNGNGNDVYELLIAGVRSDIYGIVPGNAGATTGSSDFTMPWAYSRGYAKRRPNICAPNATFTIGEWVIGGNNSLGTANTDGNAQIMADNTSPNSHSNICAAGNDCNGNGRPDATDIALGFSRDCNANGLPDECDISSGGSRDCNTNGIPDECEIAQQPSRDCNRNGILDSCELANNDCNRNGILDACDIASGTSQDVNANGIPDSCEPFLFDCNGNQIEDATDIRNGTSRDCNGNVIPDECELFNGRLTDANGNGTPDACEAAYVAEADVNATVNPSPFGVRNGPNGLAFLNVEGSDLLTFASYGGLRFNMAPMKAKFDTAYGAGNWHVEKAYLFLMQANAAFTAGGDVQIVWTGNDAQNFSDVATPEVTLYENYLTDYPDAATVATYTFVRGADLPPGNPGGNGTIESHQIGDVASPNEVVNELNGASGNLTLLMRDATTSVAATYAGTTNTSWRGPTIVVFAAPGASNPCPACAADYNQDGGVDGGDIAAFFPDWESSAGCADVNQDGGIDGGDIEAFFQVWQSGGC